jgi:hypothetical protein
MKRGVISFPLIWFCAVLAAGAAFTWWLAVRTDHELRVSLLQQTRLVAQAIDVEQIRALSGTAADLHSPDYLRLKSKLDAMRSANSQCRFIYLLGLKPDGSVFFYADNEQVGSKDESPAGMVYADAPEGFRRVFSTGIGQTEGPFTDQWGTFVSGAEPCRDPQTGAVVAVLGMDIDARDWKWSVATRAALPVGLMLVLLIGIATAIASARHAEASPKPVLRRLLQPMAAALILMTAGAGALLWTQHQQHLTQTVEHLASDVSGYLHAALKLQASGLAAALSPIVNDQRVQRALRERDADRLLSDWQPIFETMRRENNITHVYFSDTNRVCLLRMHKPDRRGDQLNRFTALEAEKTSKFASGFELGPMGNLTLRVVHPVLADGTLVGYVELGKEIAEVLQSLHFQSGCQLAVTLFKQRLNQASWEEGMRAQGRAGDWNRMPHSVAAYASQGRLPDAFLRIADRSASALQPHDETRKAIASAGRNWRVSATPLTDASGTEVGALLVMRDITSETAAFTRLTALGGMIGAVLLTLLLAFIYVLLRGTDAGIRSQQDELQKSKENLLATLRSIGDGVIACDDRGNVSNLNAVAETLTGWRADEARGRPIAEVFRIAHAETGQPVEIPVARALREDRTIGLANHTVLIARDGAKRQIADSCAPIHAADGRVLGAVLVFRDVTEEYRRRELLRESEAMQRILLDSLPVGVVIIDPVTRVIERVNDHVTALFGASADHLVGRRCHALLCPAEEKTCPVCDLDKTADTSERVMLRVDGSRIPIIKTVKRVQLNGQFKLLECFVDVSERKRAEEALQQTADRLSLATRAGGVGVWELDLVNNRLLWDDQMYRLYGLTREQCADPYACWRASVRPEDLAKEDAEIQLAIRGEKEFDTEFRITWPDKSVHNIRALAVVRRDASGKPQHLIGTNWDITVLRTQTEELANTVQELQLFNQLIINRELVMVGLKKQINDLRLRLGEPAAYDLQGLEPEAYGPEAG